MAADVFLAQAHLSLFIEVQRRMQGAAAATHKLGLLDALAQALQVFHRRQWRRFQHL